MALAMSAEECGLPSGGAAAAAAEEGAPPSEASANGGGSTGRGSASEQAPAAAAVTSAAAAMAAAPPAQPSVLQQVGVVLRCYSSMHSCQWAGHHSWSAILLSKLQIRQQCRCRLAWQGLSSLPEAAGTSDRPAVKKDVVVM